MRSQLCPSSTELSACCVRSLPTIPRMKQLTLSLHSSTILIWYHPTAAPHVVRKREVFVHFDDKLLYSQVYWSNLGMCVFLTYTLTKLYFTSPK